MITRAVVFGSSIPSDGQSYGFAEILGSIFESERVEMLGVSGSFLVRYALSITKFCLLPLLLLGEKK